MFMQNKMMKRKIVEDMLFAVQEILSDLFEIAELLSTDRAIVGRFDGRPERDNTMIISLFVNMFVGLSIAPICDCQICRTKAGRKDVGIRLCFWQYSADCFFLFLDR